MQISAKTRLICLIVAAVFLFGLLVGTSTYLIINHLNNSKALLNSSARVYLGNLFDGADALNSTTYNNLITELGAYDTNTIKQQSDINEGVPIVFQMGTAPNGNPIEWQVVYQYGDIITVWMTDIYTCAGFGPSGPANTYYSDASVRDVLQDIYELIESQNSSMQNIVVSTNDSKIPEEYKEKYLSVLPDENIDSHALYRQIYKYKAIVDNIESIEEKHEPIKFLINYSENNNFKSGQVLNLAEMEDKTYRAIDEVKERNIKDSKKYGEEFHTYDKLSFTIIIDDGEEFGIIPDNRHDIGDYESFKEFFDKTYTDDFKNYINNILENEEEEEEEI